MPRYVHWPSRSLCRSSLRKVVPPFFTMCMSMSTAAQRQLVAPHGAAERLAGLWILKGSVTAAQVDDGAKIDISVNLALY